MVNCHLVFMQRKNFKLHIWHEKQKVNYLIIILFTFCLLTNIIKIDIGELIISKNCVKEVPQCKKNGLKNTILWLEPLDY